MAENSTRERRPFDTVPGGNGGDFLYISKALNLTKTAAARDTAQGHEENEGLFDIPEGQYVVYGGKLYERRRPPKNIKDARILFRSATRVREVGDPEESSPRHKQPEAATRASSPEVLPTPETAPVQESVEPPSVTQGSGVGGEKPASAPGQLKVYKLKPGEDLVAFRDGEPVYASKPSHISAEKKPPARSVESRPRNENRLSVSQETIEPPSSPEVPVGKRPLNPEVSKASPAKKYIFGERVREPDGKFSEWVKKSFKKTEKKVIEGSTLHSFDPFGVIQLLVGGLLALLFGFFAKKEKEEGIYQKIADEAVLVGTLASPELPAAFDLIFY